ncbi:MAG: hypothetical protein GVY27_01865, partial [Deinococcus-Thermus bacterium]|nr:hypothetical protein [Deinococcota bacterium]
MDNDRPRVLMLSGHLIDSNQAAEALRQHYDVSVFSDTDEAIASLRSEMYQAIFADVGDFLPLERALFDRQATLVLNTIGEGVCIVDDTGVC